MLDEFSTKVLAKQANAVHDELTTHIVEDMHRRSLNGESPRVEEYLDKHSALRDSTDALLRVIYEEYCIRQERGEPVTPTEYLKRFPQWRHRLKALLECHRLLVPEPPSSEELAQVAKCGGEFRVVGELGKGSEGQVFLALQVPLANRPVVLKVAPAEGQEHLTLARLQHTHIVPLYGLYDDPFMHHRILCMPFLGGATLEQLLDHLRPIPLDKRSGTDVLAALDRMQANCPVQVAAQGPARAYLARLDFAQAMCWMGACLAEGLAFAHQRELVHLDVKPSNILITADAQPMLLDFHIAQKPVMVDGKSPAWIGGTPRFASPEQMRAMAAMSMGANVTEVIGGPSDLYSLGIVLYKSLGGELPIPEGKPIPRLNTLNSQVSPGLADIIAKCLEPNIAERYANAQSLAEDLRRHLTHQPLKGVRNRSWSERWKKWRRRRPYALHLAVMLLAVLGAFGTFGVLALRSMAEDRRLAEGALVRGEEHLRKANYDEARREFSRGAELCGSLPNAGELRDVLARRAEEALKLEQVERLHRITDRLRLQAGTNGSLAPALEEQWNSIWKERYHLLTFASEQLGLAQRERIRTDLQDLGLMWVELSLRGRGKEDSAFVMRAVSQLNEIESDFGESRMLWLLKADAARFLGKKQEAEAAEQKASKVSPRSAWEYTSLGRTLLAQGKLDESRVALERATTMQPDGFWSNFFLGQCAYRLKDFKEAEASFRACLALQPRNTRCHFNRGLALAGMDKREQAILAFTRAIDLEPHLGDAYVQRAAVHIQAKHFPPALSDLKAASTLDSDRGELFYQFALAYHGMNQQAEALSHAQKALDANPAHAGAASLAKTIKANNP